VRVEQAPPGDRTVVGFARGNEETPWAWEALGAVPAATVAAAPSWDDESPFVGPATFAAEVEPAGHLVGAVDLGAAPSEWESIEGEVTEVESTAIPSSALEWPGASAEKLAFMRAVYDAHVQRSTAAGARFTAELPDDALDVITGAHRARKDAAVKARALLAAARAALTADGLAARLRIGVVSAYRPAIQQFAIWQGKGRSGGFPHYYEQMVRQGRLRAGDYGPRAVAAVAAEIAGWIAVPGYSNHQDGLAIDFGTGAAGKALGAIGRRAWFHKWLEANGHRFGFHPYEKEPWHWTYRGAPARVPPRPLPASSGTPGGPAAPGPGADRGDEGAQQEADDAGAAENVGSQENSWEDAREDTELVAATAAYEALSSAFEATEVADPGWETGADGELLGVGIEVSDLDRGLRRKEAGEDTEAEDEADGEFGGEDEGEWEGGFTGEDEAEGRGEAGDADVDAESGEVEQGEAEAFLGDRESGAAPISEESGTAVTFPSGATLHVVSAPTGPGEAHHDPWATGNPVLDTSEPHRSTRLSASFTVGELARSGGERFDRARIDPALVACLQKLRDHVGKAVTVTSGYRPYRYNEALYTKRYRGTPTRSRHSSGQAADVRIGGMSGMQVVKAAIDACGSDLGVGIADTYGHIDIRGSWARWTYFGDRTAKGRAALAEIDAYRRERQQGQARPVIDAISTTRYVAVAVPSKKIDEEWRAEDPQRTWPPVQNDYALLKVLSTLRVQGVGKPHARVHALQVQEPLVPLDFSGLRDSDVIFIAAHGTAHGLYAMGPDAPMGLDRLVDILTGDGNLGRLRKGKKIVIVLLSCRAGLGLHKGLARRLAKRLSIDVTVGGAQGFTFGSVRSTWTARNEVLIRGIPWVMEYPGSIKLADAESETSAREGKTITYDGKRAEIEQFLNEKKALEDSMTALVKKLRSTEVNGALDEIDDRFRAQWTGMLRSQFELYSTAKRRSTLEFDMWFDHISDGYLWADSKKTTDREASALTTGRLVPAGAGLTSTR
jgi:uncharacterized protein YcbK (DUF882 family)